MPLLEFFGCWQRIERAKTHSEKLAKLWSDLLEDEPYSPVLEIDDDGTGAIRVVPRYDSLPDVFALELGETLYQLRAALDGAIYAAAICETGRNPPPNHQALEFPVCGSAERFNQVGWKIAPLTDERRTIVESVQPYNAPPNLDPDITVLCPQRTLRILNDWARMDRHRMLHVVGSWASNRMPLIAVPPPAFVSFFGVTGDCMLEDECEIASFKIEGFRPGMDVQANPNLSIDIAVDEGPPPAADNDTLGARIKAMQILVRSLVSGLEKSCATRLPKR